MHETIVSAEESLDMRLKHTELILDRIECVGDSLEEAKLEAKKKENEDDAELKALISAIIMEIDDMSA